MKYILPTITLAFVLIGSTTTSYAQTTKTPVVTTPPALFDTQANAPLSTRKQYVETNLRDLLTRLSDVHARVQIATTRLGTNGIDTTTATIALTVAQTALTSANSHLALFTATPVDDRASTVTTLRTQAKAAEDSLKSARTNIIESIASLKLTLQTQ